MPVSTVHETDHALSLLWYLLFSEAKEKSSLLSMRIWLYCDYQLLLHLCYTCSCAMKCLCSSKPLVWVPPHSSTPGDSQQQTAGKTNPNWQIWEQTWKGGCDPKHLFCFKRKYFCRHCFPNQPFILRESFLLAVRPNISGMPPPDQVCIASKLTMWQS